MQDFSGADSRFDVFDRRGPLVVYEAVVAVDDFLSLPRLIEGRLHLNTDKLTHWGGERGRDRFRSEYKLLLQVKSQISSIFLESAST